MSIQVFACDHRREVEWDLPYVRLGCARSDAVVNTAGDVEIAPFDTLMSEGAQIWWVWKHLREFGNPDYVGFCHYRRFFTLAAQLPIVNIDGSQFRREFCLDPSAQEAIIRDRRADGLVFCPINAVDCEKTGCITIVDQLKWLSQRDRLGISDDICDRAFEILLSCATADMRGRLKEAMYEKGMYACNIFTMSRGLFDGYCRTAVLAATKLREYVSDGRLPRIHPRFIGYVMERFTSCYLHALIKSGKKLLTLPLMTINGERHEAWEAPSV